jgi:hypothetical protein
MTLPAGATAQFMGYSDLYMDYLVASDEVRPTGVKSGPRCKRQPTMFEGVVLPPGF